MSRPRTTSFGSRNEPDRSRSPSLGDFSRPSKPSHSGEGRLLGIGQPTLREALKELEYQGFVRKYPKRGTHVTKLTREDFGKIQEVRMALEVVAIERAALRITPETAAQLHERAAAKRFDLRDFHRQDVAFHQLLWDIAGNQYLATALERVAFGLFAFVLLQRDPEATGEFLAAAHQHKQIVQGLLTGDPKTAVAAYTTATNAFWHNYHHLNSVSISGQ